MSNLFDLSGKVAIVTGAARGIGEAIAIELARQGADVVVSDVLPGDSTVKKIKALKRKSFYVKTDISKKSEVENLINETIKQFKKIDILVNNAGIAGSQTPILNLPEQEWDKVININLKGTFLCCQAAQKHMKKGSAIINVSSVAGILGAAGAVPYCSSKGGIRLLTKALAAELAPLGIRVNSIHPGLIETKMTEEYTSNKSTSQAFLGKIPLKRFGKPIDIAGVAVFLASEASSYMTGSEVVADGGWICTL